MAPTTRRLLLNHWKFYLRSTTNAIIDARIHCDGMTEQEAVDLMVDGGFQEEAEARNKYRRARLSSTQLSTYFAGSMEMWDIELEARRRAASAAGADPASIRPGALPGGLGDTPGFRYRDHLEAVISHGVAPDLAVAAGAVRLTLDMSTRPARRPAASSARTREGQASALAFSAWNSSSVMTPAARSSWSFAISSAGETAAAAFDAASACVIICRSWAVIFGRVTM